MRPETWRAVIDGCAEPIVLVDLGASAGPPDAWTAIAPSCSYVGFEPDRRSQSDVAGGGFRTATCVPAAATDVEASAVRFYLTRSRFCSSTLRPEVEHLRKFAFADLFTVETTEDVPAITLDRALDVHGIARVHWFKADTQGTDLRLFRSLSERIRRGALAVDIEPGLIRAYEHEDMFSEAHEYFVSNGFWLSSMNVGTNVRGRQSTLAQVTGDAGAGVECVPERYRRTPVCCEARYLRELEPGALSRDDLAALATFAAMDQQPLFALEVIDAMAAAERGPAIDELARECAAALRQPASVRTPGAFARVRRRFGV
jgi:FkbM family methyltransferase